MLLNKRGSMNKVFNRKFAIICTVILLMVVMSVMLVACGEKGEMGLSAYEIAVKNGFNGSEAEWLQSLIGDKGITSSQSNYQLAENLLTCVNIQANFTTTGYKGGAYVSHGTGVIIEDDKEGGSAFILTNYHVIYDAINTANTKQSINVYLYGSEVADMAIEAKYIGGSANYDVAILSIENSDIYRLSDAQVAALGDSDKLSAGDNVRVIGNGNAEGIAISTGVVSKDSMYINVNIANVSRTLRTIRTDASINGGNSGGGLFNATGELVGIVNAKTVDTEVEGIGYALPINDLVPIANKIINGYKQSGEVSYAKAHYLGVTIKVAESRAELDKENDSIVIKESIVVNEVLVGGVADKSGLIAGDRILNIRYAGKLIEIDRQFKMSRIVLMCNEGDEIYITVIRDGVEKTITAVMGAGTTLE